MQLFVQALVVAQTPRDAGANYPASVDIKMVEVGTGKDFLLNSPVAVPVIQLLVPIQWTIDGFSVDEINWSKNGNSGKFVKWSCKSLSGQVLKAN